MDKGHHGWKQSDNGKDESRGWPEQHPLRTSHGNSSDQRSRPYAVSEQRKILEDMQLMRIDTKTASGAGSWAEREERAGVVLCLCCEEACSWGDTVLEATQVNTKQIDRRATSLIRLWRAVKYWSSLSLLFLFDCLHQRVDILRAGEKRHVGKVDNGFFVLQSIGTACSEATYWLLVCTSHTGSICLSVHSSI